MRFTKRAEGFTLIELLIALALSAFIVVGAYQFFNLIEISGKLSEENNEVQSVVPPLFCLMLKDFESADPRYSPITVNADSDGRQTVEFYTHNCYYFKGICRVKYWVFRKVGREDVHYLVRSEFRLDDVTGKGIDVPLTSRVKDFEVEVPSSDGWSRASGKLSTKLLRVLLKLERPEGSLPLVFAVRS